MLSCTAIAKTRDLIWFKNRCSIVLQVTRKNRVQEWASIALMFFSPYETLNNVLLHIYRALTTLYFYQKNLELSQLNGREVGRMLEKSAIFTKPISAGNEVA